MLVLHQRFLVGSGWVFELQDFPWTAGRGTDRVVVMMLADGAANLVLGSLDLC